MTEEHISLNNKPPAERTVHPDCINASNPYHECTDYCFKRIADAQDRIDTDATGSFDKFSVAYLNCNRFPY